MSNMSRMTLVLLLSKRSTRSRILKIKTSRSGIVVSSSELDVWVPTWLALVLVVGLVTGGGVVLDEWAINASDKL